MPLSIEQLKRNGLIILLIVIIGGVGIFLANYFSNRNDNSSQNISDKLDEQKTENEIIPPSVDPFPNDKDRDGIEDSREVELGLSPVLPDTDKDGVDDKLEIEQWKTDPLKFDTDGDGYGDGWEILQGYNPAGPGAIVNAE